MKQQNPPLVAFIKDYHLEQPNGNICFMASVHFHSENAWFKFISPVHIIHITLKHLDVLYLLNPEIDSMKIKTMFTNNHKFNYSPTRRFEIKGNSKKYGPYSIFIIPLSKNCEDKTVRELQAKQNN